jgi:hypothetical protein
VGGDDDRDPDRVDFSHPPVEPDGMLKRITPSRAPRIALLGLGALAIACARGVPPTADYTPGLGEIMTLTQMRHVKLWLAGKAGNWPLAAYELDELEEGFADAARLHPTHKSAPRPLTELIPEFMHAPLERLHTAVARHDPAAFTTAFDAFTEGCNACHRVTGFSFNVVTRPTSNPYSNQNFDALP